MTVSFKPNPAIIGAPKTQSGHRDLFFGENLEKILIAQKGEGFILGGERLFSRKAYNTLMKHLKQRIDLHGVTPHVLRHIYLTTAVGENIDSKTLQSIAGHSDHQVTMNTYVHEKQKNLIKAGQCWVVMQRSAKICMHLGSMDAFERFPCLRQSL